MKDLRDLKDWTIHHVKQVRFDVEVCEDQIMNVGGEYFPAHTVQKNLF